LIHEHNDQDDQKDCGKEDGFQGENDLGDEPGQKGQAGNNSQEECTDGSLAFCSESFQASCVCSGESAWCCRSDHQCVCPSQHVRYGFGGPHRQFRSGCGLPAHYGVQVHPALWVLVLGGLVYSALTVFKWGVAAFSSPVKSVGFVLLLEGTLTFSNEHALALGALAILAFINAVATACNLIAQKKEAKQEAIAAKKAGK
jgi:hypothetical protein